MNDADYFIDGELEKRVAEPDAQPTEHEGGPSSFADTIEAIRKAIQFPGTENPVQNIPDKKTVVDIASVLMGGRGGRAGRFSNDKFYNVGTRRWEPRKQNEEVPTSQIVERNEGVIRNKAQKAISEQEQTKHTNKQNSAIDKARQDKYDTLQKETQSNPESVDVLINTLIKELDGRPNVPPSPLRKSFNNKTEAANAERPDGFKRYSSEEAYQSQMDKMKEGYYTKRQSLTAEELAEINKSRRNSFANMTDEEKEWARMKSRERVRRFNQRKGEVDEVIDDAINNGPSESRITVGVKREKAYTREAREKELERMRERTKSLTREDKDARNALIREKWQALSEEEKEAYRASRRKTD